MQDVKNYFTVKGKNAEKVLHDLALETFLTDWCYLNPLLPNGKELCDLLVVFDDIAIIWAVKDLKLDKQGKYKESEVEKNLKQLSGARRQLFDLKTKIELENPRRGRELFDPTTVNKVYLISALLGESEAPFPLIENIKGRTVHVFTKRFTEIILNELDTISDFCEYIREKEAFISKNTRLTILGGEEELLAYYLWNVRSFKPLEESDSTLIEEGLWERLQNNPKYRAKKEEDKISYGWDHIIDRAHEGGSKEYETVARELARPNRFERRYLSKIFLDTHVNAHKDNHNNIFRRLFSGKDVTYCFLFLDDSVPRNTRMAMLADTCYVARGKISENIKVLGIATEKKIRPACSYDFCLLEKPDWTEEDQKHMEKLQEERKIFVNPTIHPFHEDEYPV